jgi:hypothetical protein
MLAIFAHQILDRFADKSIEVKHKLTRRLAYFRTDTNRPKP